MSLRIPRLPGSLPSLSGSNSGECAADPRIASLGLGGSLLRSVRLRLKTDEELVLDLLANEPDALTVLFERYSALVFRIACRILRNDAEAEDAVQQVFFDVFRAAEQFEPEKGSFKTWLLMFTYHRTFNSRRQLHTQGYYDADSVEALPQELMQGAARRLSLASAEAVVLVGQVLKLIQPRQRRTIELIYYEGLTAEQTSEVTGESVRVVRHNLYRGLEKLRGALGSKSPKSQQKKAEPPERSRT